MGSPKASKAKGRAWENAIVEYLDSQDIEGVERRRLAGINDKGDIAGIKKVMIEAKGERSWKIPEWMREVDRETLNAKALIGVCWAKIMGKAKAQDGVVIMRPATFLTLLRQAGYLPLDQDKEGGVSSNEPL